MWHGLPRNRNVRETCHKSTLNETCDLPYRAQIICHSWQCCFFLTCSKQQGANGARPILQKRFNTRKWKWDIPASHPDLSIWISNQMRRDEKLNLDSVTSQRRRVYRQTRHPYTSRRMRFFMYGSETIWNNRTARSRPRGNSEMERAAYVSRWLRHLGDWSLSPNKEVKRQQRSL